LVIVFPVLFSFGHCFACPFFFWPLFCLSFFLLVKWLRRKKDRQNNDQKKKGQAKQWPKEKRTGKTMTKRKKDRQNNLGQKKLESFDSHFFCMGVHVLFMSFVVINAN
jgi:flagellar biosynthesis component FlhA